jgi:hypothetical protein
LVFTRTNGVWTQQGEKLVATGGIGNDIGQGTSVALSADGNTAIVGGPGDSLDGAAWVFTRTNGVWRQQGNKLVGTGGVDAPERGYFIDLGFAVALSADGNTALIAGPGDNFGVGAVWVFTRSNGIWAQQGQKLVGGGAVGASKQGISVALSTDGNTAIVGGFDDNEGAGASWVFTRTNGVWTQQGDKLVGTGGVDAAQGRSVALSADGNIALVGGSFDKHSTGAVWYFVRRNGVWRQQGHKMVGAGAIGHANQGVSVALSADGKTAIWGGPVDDSRTGATWVFKFSANGWNQDGDKLVGTGAIGTLVERGGAVALSADGNTAVAGGRGANSFVGATWVFVERPTITSVSPSSGLVGGGKLVAILGSNFSGATSVTIGGHTAQSFTVKNSTKIVAITPPHAAGAVSVKVTTSAGSGTEANAFTYQ